jgi:hypothetical protein
MVVVREKGGRGDRLPLQDGVAYLRIRHAHAHPHGFPVISVQYQLFHLASDVQREAHNVTDLALCDRKK